MLTRCLACDRAFPTNAELEWLPRGRRVAFDPHRGRLWLLCTWCAHWSLVPLEARWEAVEELESRAARRAVVLAATEQVTLLALGGVEALRVGRALPREEAWWRYGRELRGRRLRHTRITSAGGWIASAATVTGVAGLFLVLPEVALWRGRALGEAPGRARRSGAAAAESFERWFRYGRCAWRGRSACGACGAELTSLRFAELDAALLLPDGSVQVRCRSCAAADGSHVIAGADAERLIRRGLARENIAGATDDQLAAAIALLRTGELDARRRSEPLALRGAPREQLLALELSATQRYEARLLGWDVAQLETRWRVEEETAAISDRELTPGPRAITPASDS